VHALVCLALHAAVEPLQQCDPPAMAAETASSTTRLAAIEILSARTSNLRLAG
jgi:hypothetical protein